jgi:hypothetical protein
MSALPPKADIVQHGGDVRFVPKSDILRYTRPRNRRSLIAAGVRFIGAATMILSKQGANG